MCDDQLDLADPPSLVPVGGKLLVEVGGEVLLCLTHKFIIFQRYLYIIAPDTDLAGYPANIFCQISGYIVI